MAEGGNETKPKRKTAGNRMQEVLEAVRSPSLQEKRSPCVTPLPLKDDRPPSEVAKEFKVDQEYKLLSAELQKLKLEDQKSELRLEINKLKKKLQADHVTEDVSPSRDRDVSNQGQGRKDGADMGKQTPLEYTSFLWINSLETQRQTLDLGGGITLDMGKRSTNLAGLTPEMWTYANLGLLRDKMQKGEFAQSDVDSYLRYMQEICRYSAKYVWQSIVLYDKEYRIMQAKEGFQWGTPSQDIRDHQLIQKASTQPLQAMKPNDNKRPYRPRGPFTPEGFEICRRYNFTFCRDELCKLKHVCMVCFKRHSKVDHDSTADHGWFRGSSRDDRSYPKNGQPMMPQGNSIH